MDDSCDGMPYPHASLGEAGERGVLGEVFAALGEQPAEGVLVGPGDDTALLAVCRGAVLATTDAMVRGTDWLDQWSGPADVGAKGVTQNLSDLAAMGGVGTGLLVTLVAAAATPMGWVRQLTDGLVEAAGRAGVPVLGGDLSSAPEGVVMLSITALGELGEGVDRPVLRSGARPGDRLAVSGPLGRSGAGLELLRRGVTDGPLVGHHRRPVTDLGQGPVAARAGAGAMLDVSDGLVRDGDRLARASGVVLELDEDALRELARPLAVELGDHQQALRAVLAGGEEHELLACFPDEVPPGWTVLGRAVAADATGRPGVVRQGRLLDPASGGWDHFGG